MSEKRDLRQELTNKIIEALENGTAPWQKPWDGNAVPLLRPFNPTNGTVYRGGNMLHLAMHGFTDPRWCTYKQAQERGWQVRKGEKSALVEYWQWDREEEQFNPETGQMEKVRVRLERPRVFFASVFNAQQMDNVPEYSHEVQGHAWEPTEKAEAILQASGAKIFHDQSDRAFYRRTTDEIHLPLKEAFPSAEHYYGTALHELGHWTGHESRLAREFGASFGDEKYAKEELRAELASLFLSAEIGLPVMDGQHFEQHAAYLQSWVKVLKEDKNEIFRAARDAELITEYVMGLELGQQHAHEQAAQQDTKDAAYGLPGDAVAGQQPPAASGERTYINIPYSQRNEAKALGAKWDKEAISWYVPAGVDLTTFAKWPVVDAATIQTQKAKPQPQPGARTYLEVPKAEKDEAKALGARWDRDKMKWYVPEGVDVAKFAKWPVVEATAEKAQEQQSDKLYLEVDYKERNEVKALGARWDKDAQKWYVPAGLDPAPFERWNVPAETVAFMKLYNQYESILLAQQLAAPESNVFAGIVVNHQDMAKELVAISLAVKNEMDINAELPITGKTYKGDVWLVSDYFVALDVSKYSNAGQIVIVPQDNLTVVPQEGQHVMVEFNEAGQGSVLTEKDKTNWNGYGEFESRKAVEQQATAQLGPGVSFSDPKPNGKTVGEIVGNSEQHTAQHVGRKEVVVHEQGKLNQVPDMGKKVTVQYQNGQAVVTEKNREKALTR